MILSFFFRLLPAWAILSTLACDFSVAITEPKSDNQILGPGDRLTIEFSSDAQVDPSKTHIIQYFYQKDAKGNLVVSGKPDTLRHALFSSAPLEAGRQYSTYLFGKEGFEPYTTIKAETPFKTKPSQFAQTNMTRANVRLTQLTFTDKEWIWDADYKTYSAAINIYDTVYTRILLTFDQPANGNDVQIRFIPVDSLWRKRPIEGQTNQYLPPDDSLFIINDQMMIKSPLMVHIPKGSNTAELNVKYNPAYGYEHGRLVDYMAFKIDVSGLATRPPVVFICSTDK